MRNTDWGQRNQCGPILWEMKPHSRFVQCPPTRVVIDWSAKAAFKPAKKMEWFNQLRFSLFTLNNFCNWCTKTVPRNTFAEEEDAEDIFEDSLSESTSMYPAIISALIFAFELLGGTVVGEDLFNFISESRILFCRCVAQFFNETYFFVLWKILTWHPGVVVAALLSYALILTLLPPSATSPTTTATNATIATTTIAPGRRANLQVWANLLPISMLPYDKDRWTVGRRKLKKVEIANIAHIAYCPFCPFPFFQAHSRDDRLLQTDHLRELPEGGLSPGIWTKEVRGAPLKSDDHVPVSGELAFCGEIRGEAPQGFCLPRLLRQDQPCSGRGGNSLEFFLKPRNIF